MKKIPFFTLPDGRQASIYCLRLNDGFGIDICDYGATVTGLFVPDRNGTLRDVVLGWKEPEVYLRNPGYLGATVGRVPNRIGGGRFTLNGKIYQSCLNDRQHSTLHGGFGYSHRLWEVACCSAREIVLHLTSPDGDAGFPGKLEVFARYTITPDHTVEVVVTADADAPTIADFTNHTYFNLGGENSGSCAGHHITLAADRVTEVDEFLVPTGKLLDVTGTRFDLRQGKSFADIYAAAAVGFDDNFILGESDNVMHRNAAVVYDETSGIEMKFHTDRPGIQVYMGAHLDNAPCGKSGKYVKYSGFCLESQCWPDAVNHPEFPQIFRDAEHPFQGYTCWQFSVKK
ncbi:MAG: galactose mutarotase [Lentisphaeria bacterium]|nr:galactose mutarotase [Lentisphaeria bacterium]